MVTVDLTEDDAKLFIEFQKHFTLIAHVIGCIDALNIKDISNSSVLMDFDNKGLVIHSSITKHYRKTLA